jgi:phosphoribosylaminoimidazolecarboxamide formyltransferase/IMP cyclohydrolase
LRVRRALISAHDVAVFLPLAKGLSELGTELWATSGTMKHLAAKGIPSKSTEELTGIGSWFDGRVKTLHPKLFGGILAPRTEEGEKEMASHEVFPFDLVAVHLYPFEEALAKGGEDFAKMVELIDVGGPSMLRAAAKNFRWVVPVPGPSEAETVMKELREGKAVSYVTRRALAAEVFKRTLLYDSAIYSWLGAITAPKSASKVQPPPAMVMRCNPEERLRYGENPHQMSWVYSISSPGVPLTPWPLKVVKGDALSYNNFLDMETTLSLMSEFDEPAAAVVKHATPCGVATGSSIEKALEEAIATDEVARYGCVIAVNRPITTACMDAMKGTFVDLLVAPEYSNDILDRLTKRPKLKAVRLEGKIDDIVARPRLEARTAAGRFLVEECDQRRLSLETLRQVSKLKASPDELKALAFAWKVVRNVRSNAIVLANGTRTVGIGGGQTSRVGAVNDALRIAGDRAKGAVMASDAYFPFPDGVEAAVSAGVKAIIHPGGSIRDKEAIEAADKLGASMYLTGWRVFRH